MHQTKAGHHASESSPVIPTGTTIIARWVGRLMSHGAPHGLVKAG